MFEFITVRELYAVSYTHLDTEYGVRGVVSQLKKNIMIFMLNIIF